MTKEEKANSNAAGEYLDDIISVMKQNEAFLRKNAQDTYAEIVKLINDAIIMLPVEKKPEDYAKYSMIFFKIHILMPFSYAIHVDMLTGNIPVCSMELRLMLESIVKCYLADLKYPDQTFFRERLKSLEDANLSISKLMKELGRKLGLNFVALWSKLSQDWIHTKGIIDRVLTQLIEKSDVPPWGLVLPMNYSESDLDTIIELRNRISEFRSLLKSVMAKYQQEGSYENKA